MLTTFLTVPMLALGMSVSSADLPTQDAMFTPMPKACAASDQLISPMMKTVQLETRFGPEPIPTGEPTIPEGCELIFQMGFGCVVDCGFGREFIFCGPN